MSQITITAAELRAIGRFGNLAHIALGTSILGEGRIVTARDGVKGRGKAKAKLPVCPTEDEEQAVVIAWAKANEKAYPALALLFHIPNGGLRHKATAGRMVAQGVKPGVPDLCLPVPRGVYHGLWVEMKRRKGGTTSDNQDAWLSALTVQGHRAVVCCGADEAIAEIKKYMGMA